MARALRDRRWAEDAFRSDRLVVRNPYWGDFAQAPAWDLASIPAASTRRQALGGDTSRESEMLSAAAREDFESVVGSLAIVAREGGGQAPKAEQDAFWRAAGDYAARLPAPDWVQQTRNDRAFLTRLEEEVSQAKGRVALGMGSYLTTAANAVLQRSVDLANRQAAAFVRSMMPRGASFLGDTLSYLKEGPARSQVRAAVLNDVIAAALAAKADGAPLVLVGHSFGGVILYDLLSDPQVQAEMSAALGEAPAVDLLMTVGSQVGLFEEFKLFAASSDAYGAGAARAPAPVGVKAWWNVIDEMDVLAYAAEPVFAGVTDLSLNTLAGVANAHTAYFTNPVFYARVYQRVRTLGLIG